MRLLKRMAQFYVHQIEDHPIRTQSATAGTLFLLGDLLCQTIEHHTNTKSTSSSFFPQIDWTRSAKMASFGYLFGPVSYFWYRLLDKKVVFKTAASKSTELLQDKIARPNLKTVLSKVALDEMCFAPACIASLFCFSTLLNGGGVGDATDKLKRDFGPTFISDMCVWIPAQTFNFYFVPQLYRVLFVSFVSVFWNCYLSFVTNRDKSSSRTEENQSYEEHQHQHQHQHQQKEHMQEQVTTISSSTTGEL